MASASAFLREALWKYRHPTCLLIQCWLLWQCLSEFSCFGNWHCEFESCWDTLASFTDLLLTPHTRSRHSFIVHFSLKGKHRGCSTMLSSPVAFLIAHIVFSGKKEKQWAVTDNGIYTCQLGKVNVFIYSRLRKAKCDMFQEDRHMGELQRERQAKKNRDACKKEKKGGI